MIFAVGLFLTITERRDVVAIRTAFTAKPPRLIARRIHKHIATWFSRAAPHPVNPMLLRYRDITPTLAATPTATKVGA